MPQLPFPPLFRCVCSHSAAPLSAFLAPVAALGRRVAPRLAASRARVGRRRRERARVVVVVVVVERLARRTRARVRASPTMASGVGPSTGTAPSVAPSRAPPEGTDAPPPAGIPHAVAVGPFESVEDSPFLRVQMRALEEDVDALRERAGKLGKACAAYRDGLEDGFVNELNFSEATKGFYGDLDAPFARSVGGRAMDAFVSGIQEIADARSMLLGAVERELCEPVAGVARDAHRRVAEARRRFDRCSAEYERSRDRFLALTKDARPDQLSSAESELGQTRRVFETARFELMAQLHDAGHRASVEFKRRFANAAHAHLSFFKLGHEIFAGLEPFVHETLAACDAEDAAHAEARDALAGAMADYQVSLRVDADESSAELLTERSNASAAMDSGRALTSERSRAIAAAMRGEDEKLAAMAMAASRVPMAAEGNARSPPRGAPGPEGAAPDPASNAQDPPPPPPPRGHGHARQPSSGGVGGSTVLAQGYLLKRSSSMRADWKRRYFVLDALGHLTYFRGDKDVREGRAKETVSLLTATIKPDLEDAPNMRFCFRVVSPGKTYFLQAESQGDRARWMEAITAAIAELLNNAAAIRESVSNIPSALASHSPNRPGSRAGSRSGHHSRSGSFQLHSRSGSFGFIGGVVGGGHARTFSAGSSVLGSDAASDAESWAAASASAATLPEKDPPENDPGNTGRLAAELSSLDVDAAPLDSTRDSLLAIRAAPGNDRCADCGQPDPEWASLNLGVVLCIRCGGAHRSLGAHVSKVRSCTLDVRVWEPSVVEMFARWGNARANAVWEGRGDAAVAAKPGAGAEAEARRAFVEAKYARRAFMSGGGDGYDWREALAGATLTDDVPRAMEALARGADPEGPGGGDDLLAGVEATLEAARDANGGGGGARTAPVLHVAAARGCAAMVEALLQRRADVSARDGEGRTALHACAESEAEGGEACAKLLLGRGASPAATDDAGRTPLDVAMARGSIKDERLFVMLSGAGS